MRLTNFEIHTIVVRGLGYEWDLHNWCDFEGIEFSPELGVARLKWRIMTEFPFVARVFAPAAPARTCAIRFDGLRSLEVTRVTSDALGEDAKTLCELKMVDPREKTPVQLLAVGFRTESTSDDGRLLLRFPDGYDIEVVADEATFEAEFAPSEAPQP